MPGFSESIEAYHETASAARKLDDFGDDDYREALGELCRSLDEDADLTELGRVALERMILDALEARLLVEDGWRRHPEARDVRIERPLVIVGLPRSGTTALHHLLYQSQDFQALEHWLMRTPKPRPPRDRWKDDADYLASEARVRMMYERSPEMRAIHEIEADLPDECWNLFSQNFAHSSWEANVNVPQYAAWWANSDMTPVYRRHRRNVQLIGLPREGTRPERRWLFKDATHLFDLDGLFSVYPDAMIVQPHRDPVRFMPSICSLCWSARDPLNANADRKAFARSALDLWQRSIDSMMRAREGRDPRQFYDLAFEDFVSDPLQAIRDIFTHFDLELSNEAESAIRRFHDANPRGKHGEHRYSLAEWGFDADEITERFEAYTRRYAVRRSA